jgi:hypothetical protein
VPVLEEQMEILFEFLSNTECLVEDSLGAVGRISGPLEQVDVGQSGEEVGNFAIQKRSLRLPQRCGNDL